MKIPVKVVPNASRDRIVGWLGDRLKISVTAPPERGRANRAVIDVLAAALDVPRSRIRVVSGGKTPSKIIEVGGPETLAGKLRRT